MRVSDLVCALVFSLVAAGAHAADPNGRYHIIGAGSVKCQQYSQATDQQKLFAHTWMAGYVTALNRATPDNYHIVGNTTPESMYGMVGKYCADNPDTSLGIAVHKVIEHLHPNRIRKSPN
ncbi:MAG: hypothetical protein KF889_08690 [Alphaproteobacteria bacterium]|nr:hypothetical protein [Alphaproteobacteria bacterium]MCW5740898.1 hypothetical protein [Alphaproteobacteria bacterium]